MHRKLSDRFSQTEEFSEIDKISQYLWFKRSSDIKDIYLKSKMFAGEGYILFTIIFSFVYNINKFLEFTTIHQDVHFNETTRSDIFKIF